MNRTILLALAILPATVFAQDDPKLDPKQDLTQLNLEDLMKVEVTSASKSAQSLSSVPSALYVITEEEIRRSGSENIPEALRLAPGVNVSQIDSTKWMVSIRGFNNRFANKLLVLIDGQSIYTPLFSGVYWDAHAIPLEEVDRIEVIRGPGGSLWGANAVNGVINIITKHSAKTQGGTLSTEFGSDTKYHTGAQYGDKFGKNSTYRIYANALSQGSHVDAFGISGSDDWTSLQTGLRFDSGTEIGTRFMFKTDIQSEHLGQRYAVSAVAPPYSQTLTSRYPVSGINSVARWERNEVSGKADSLQLSFAHSDRLSAPDAAEQRDTEVIDYQTQFKKVGHHALTLGAGYSRSTDTTKLGSLVVFKPLNFTENLYSAFIHDTVDIKSNLKLLIGSKFEHNAYTGWEIQPNAQLLYTPNEHRSYWYSVSRAVRTPSRADTAAGFNSGTIPGVVPTFLNFLGNQKFVSEEVIANEIGTRFTLKNNTFIDLAAFYNDYKKLRSFEPAAPYFDVDHAVQPFFFGNKLSGQTAGLEAALKTKLRPWWNLSLNASVFSERLRLSPSSKDQFGLYKADGRGGASNHMFQIHSNMDLPHHMEFDNDLYYVGGLINGGAPAYYKLDTRIGWSPSPTVQFSLGIRNALSPGRIEAGEATFETVENVPRSVYLKLTLRF